MTPHTAIIFDMDGVLIDSEKIWHNCELDYLRQFIADPPASLQTDILGRSIYGIYDLLCDRFPAEMQSVSRNNFLKTYEQFGLEQIYARTNLLDGVAALLAALAANNTPIALASSSPRPWIDATLARHKLEKYFPPAVIVSGCAVANAKPDPEIFLTAAAKLGVAPAGGAVIEDSGNGVAAGKAAGMFVYGLRNGFNDAQNLAAADKIIYSLHELI